MKAPKVIIFSATAVFLSTVIIFILWVFVFNGHENKVQITLCDQLLAARSDEEKWQIVVRRLAPRCPPGKDYESVNIPKPEDAFREEIVRSGHEFFLRCYPGIVKRLQFTVVDLEKMGRHVDSIQPMPFGVEISDRVVAQGEIPHGELVKGWLRVLVGRTFRNKAEFDKWLEENRDCLVWNQSLGKFEIKGNPCSLPGYKGTDTIQIP